jgi:hypothetical protein
MADAWICMHLHLHQKTQSNSSHQSALCCDLLPTCCCLHLSTRLVSSPCVCLGHSRECAPGSRYLVLDAEEEKLDPALHLGLLRPRGLQHAAYGASLAALEGE